MTQEKGIPGAFGMPLFLTDPRVARECMSSQKSLSCMEAALTSFGGSWNHFPTGSRRQKSVTTATLAELTILSQLANCTGIMDIPEINRENQEFVPICAICDWSPQL
jgi:hypothetical protein